MKNTKNKIFNLIRSNGVACYTNLRNSLQYVKRCLKSFDTFGHLFDSYLTVDFKKMGIDYQIFKHQFDSI